MINSIGNDYNIAELYKSQGTGLSSTSDNQNSHQNQDDPDYINHIGENQESYQSDSYAQEDGQSKNGYEKNKKDEQSPVNNPNGLAEAKEKGNDQALKVDTKSLVSEKSFGGRQASEGNPMGLTPEQGGIGAGAAPQAGGAGAAPQAGGAGAAPQAGGAGAAPQAGGAGAAPGGNSKGLTPEEAKEVERLKKMDKAVRAQVQAEISAAGENAGTPVYTYQSGPDNGQYATSGSVPVDKAAANEDSGATAKNSEPLSKSASDSVKPAVDENDASMTMAELRESEKEEDESNKLEGNSVFQNSSDDKINSNSNLVSEQKNNNKDNLNENSIDRDQRASLAAATYQNMQNSDISI